MEALPTMPMIAPQFRTSTLSYDNIPNFDFRYRVKEFIVLNFAEDPHEFDSAFDELSQLKFEANIPSPTVEQICKLKRYYGQLCMMQKRFPMAPGEQLETPFAWNDGLVDMRSAHSEVTINDIEFEKASVMFNIGACHAQFAAEQPRDTQDSIKTAFMHFQYAAYAFEQLNTYRNSEMFYPSVDLDGQVVLFYYKVLMAQAQECLVQKSLLDNRSPAVIAKLALWIYETYEAAHKIVYDWTANVTDSVQKYYAQFVQHKCRLYGCIAFMSFGDHVEKEEKKMGWRLQYYNVGVKFMEIIDLNDRKEQERFPELTVTYMFLFDVMSAKQKNAEKENNFIYHDRVPKESDAIDMVKKDGMCKVKALSFDPMDPSVCGDDIFGRLLPQEVIETCKSYETEKAECLQKNKDVIASFDARLDAMLERAEFDKLRHMLSEGKNSEAMFEIPDELMRRNADMTAYPDCIPNLIERLRESSDTARVAEAKLNTLISKLSAIDLPRLKSDEGFILISKELERLAEHLAQAKANNVSLNKAIAANSSQLQLLSLPCNEMWQKIIPEWNAPREMSPEETNLRRMVDKVLEMKYQRQTILTQIEETIKQDDISKKLIGVNKELFPNVINEELAKYGRFEQLIKLNVAAQEGIVRAFADANADFCTERIQMQKAKEQYDRNVVELINAYDVYRDIARKTDEGEQFYRQLMARCDQFAIPVHAMEEQYRAEVEKKERAQKEAEQHMNQIRMNREAQNAMMDFGGAPPMSMAPPGPMGPMAPIGMGQISPRPPANLGNRPPRLGDYLDSYRARKQNPQTSFQPQEEPQGPPSPTPSSVCDFPVSSRQQRMQPSPNPGQFYQGGYPPAPAQQYHAPSPVSHYQPPPPPQQPSYLPPHPAQATPVFQHPPQGAPISAPPPPAQTHQHIPPQYQNQGYQSYQQQGYGAPPAPPAQQGYAPSPPVAPAQVAPAPAALAPQAYAPPPPPPTAAPPAQVAPQNPYAVPGTPQSNWPAPPTHQGAPQGYGAPPGAPGAPGAYGGHQGYGAPPPAQPPTSNAYGAPTNAPGGFGAHPPQGVGQNNFQSAPQSAPINYGAPQNGSGAPQPPAQPSAQPQSFGQNNFQGAPQGFGAPQNVPNNYGAPQNGPGGYGAPQQAPQQAQPQGFGQNNFQGAPQGFGAPQNAPAQGIPNVGSQGSFQGAPQAPALPQTLVAQNFAPPAPSSVAPAPPPSSQPARFTPTAGAPSPWHATPAELKSPWTTTPQYHAPTPVQGASPVPSQGAGAPQNLNPPAPSRSNVDLLSDLLGDFNLQQPNSIQPAMQPVQNSQNLQAASRPDFRPAQVHPDPGKPPVAAVPPMPQQPQQHQQHQNFHQETPILSKSNLSVTEIVDPSKFQLGEGNAQKLEKRMLHHSIRTNGAPPPLNQSDPLNQIDAFSFAPQRRS